MNHEDRPYWEPSEFLTHVRDLDTQDPNLALKHISTTMEHLWDYGIVEEVQLVVNSLIPDEFSTATLWCFCVEFQRGERKFGLIFKPLKAKIVQTLSSRYPGASALNLLKAV
jgi:hypothetical protein